MSKLYVGLKFGTWKLVSINYNESDKPFYCECECGNSGYKSAKYILTHRNKNCIKCMPHNGTKHNMTKSSEYYAFNSMMQRCFNPKSMEYKNYGGRGITVDKRWVSNFGQFLQDMGTKPSKSHSLDRINNNGNYSKDNCRWATKKEQAYNRRVTVWVDYKGVSKPLSYWKRKFNISERKIKRWVVKGDFKLEDVKDITLSKWAKKVKDTKTGQVYNSIALAAKSIKMHPDSLRNRLKGTTPNETSFIYNT
jgi:hypothetical protein